MIASTEKTSVLMTRLILCLMSFLLLTDSLCFYPPPSFAFLSHLTSVDLFSRHLLIYLFFHSFHLSIFHHRPLCPVLCWVHCVSFLRFSPAVFISSLFFFFILLLLLMPHNVSQISFIVTPRFTILL